MYFSAKSWFLKYKSGLLHDHKMKNITPFLCRNNFVPIIEAIFCRSIAKGHFMGTKLSPVTKKNLKQFLYKISEYFLDILKAAFLGRIFRKSFNSLLLLC